MPGKKWTKEDIIYLTENIGLLSFQELATYFGVSKDSIASKAYKLGLSRKKASGEQWTEKEDCIIKRHFEYAPKEFLMEKLPKRTWAAIFQRGNKTFNLLRKTQDRISLNYNAFAKWNEFTAYTVGFILADGHIIANPKTNESILQIELGSGCKEVLDQIKVNLHYEGIIYHNAKRNSFKLQIRNKKIVNDLISKGIPSYNKTFTANFPKGLPLHLLNHFVRGVFDGDGSAYLDNGYLSFELLGTRPLLTAIQDRCSDFLGHVSIYDRKRGKNGANVHCLKVKGKKAVELFDWLYQDATIFLHKKFDIYSQYINSPSYGKPCEDRA